MDFERIWNNIIACEGQTFIKKGGDPFTYTVNGAAIYSELCKAEAVKSEFCQVCKRNYWFYRPRCFQQNCAWLCICVGNSER